jgi:hypothetical protein
MHWLSEAGWLVPIILLTSVYANICSGRWAAGYARLEQWRQDWSSIPARYRKLRLRSDDVQNSIGGAGLAQECHLAGHT